MGSLAASADVGSARADHRSPALRCEDADAFPLNPGSIMVIDRGYNDYALFGKWTGAGIHFVTRLRDQGAYELPYRRPASARR